MHVLTAQETEYVNGGDAIHVVEAALTIGGGIAAGAGLASPPGVVVAAVVFAYAVGTAIGMAINKLIYSDDDDDDDDDD